MMKKAQFPPQYEKIVEILHPTRAYLVGGAVRDLLLDRPIHDLDFALPQDTIGVAKGVADQMGGGFYILDPDRQACRVILIDEEGQRLVVDFTLFQGDTIEEDLAARDFTITSMALDIHEDTRIIDLFHGAQDIKDGLIRATSEKSLEDDPLRCLRAVRLAAQLGFQILPETKEQIRRYQNLLDKVSPERKRDEFFRLLEGPNQSAGIHSLQILGLYPYLLPGELSRRGLRAVKNLENLWSLFLMEHDQERAASWSKGLLIHRLGRYRGEVRELLSQELVPGRSLYQLSFTLPLLSGFPREEASLIFSQFTDQVPLSNQEAAFVEKGLEAVENWLDLSLENGQGGPVDVFRFFNQFNGAGVAAIFLTLGEFLDDMSGEDSGQERWIKNLDQARYFLEGFWERR
ncbi:MAG: hypothetical protein ACK2TZ_12090, partial [Anaerolineales bacterium]